MPVTPPVVALEPGLCSLAAVRAALFGSDGSDPSDNDTLLATWIAEESARFEAATHQRIRSYTVADAIYRGRGTDQLFLRYWPVTAVSSVEYRAAVGSWTEIDSATYDLVGHGRDYRIDYPTGFGRGTTYRVTMTVGHDGVPDDVAAIVKEAVIHRWLDSPTPGFGRDRIGMASEGVTGAAGEKNVTTAYTKAGFERVWIEAVLRYRKVESV